MGGNQKLLVLATKIPKKGKQLRKTFDRRKEFGVLSSVGAKVRHDSGGRLIVIEMLEGAEEEILRRLRGARLLPIGANVTGLTRKLDENESLFLEALKVRASAGYRGQKKKRKYGSTPEEKKLTTGPCVRGY